MDLTNHPPTEAIICVRVINMSFMYIGAWGGQQAIRGPGGGIKLTNHLGSTISTGNTLAINTNSLLQCTPWPINVSKAETGNSDE